MDMELKGSAEDGFLSSLFDRARTSWLFSIIWFLMWLSSSCISYEATYDSFHIKLMTRKCSIIADNDTWSSKQVWALPETRSDTCVELQVVISQRIVTTPCERVSASRGGGAALKRDAVSSCSEQNKHFWQTMILEMQNYKLRKAVASQIPWEIDKLI